jgi:hypothetical protein
MRFTDYSWVIELLEEAAEGNINIGNLAPTNYLTQIMRRKGIMENKEWGNTGIRNIEPGKEEFK